MSSEKICDDEISANNIISISLSFIWKISNKSVKSCSFEDHKAKLFFQDDSLMEFDLIEEINNDQKLTFSTYMVKIM